jgi:putative SOS response-associated peptidase YedK
LVPAWAKDRKLSPINAKAETAAEKPFFRHPLRKRRCLVPADGWYEWQAAGKKKQPYLFGAKDGKPFAFAALWESCALDGEQIDSCAILTTEANELVRPVHDRMPVILAPQHYDEWLDPSLTDPTRFADWLRPCPADSLTSYPVSPFVNNARHEGPDCAQPLTPA